MNQLSPEAKNESKLGSFLASRLNTDSLFSDFTYYNANIDSYITSLGEQYVGLLKKDEFILRSILQSYTENEKRNRENGILFEKLFDAFIKTCSWKSIKTITNGGIRDPGIYVLYHLSTLTAYIGESKSIEQRFVSHITSLKDKKHPNKRLQEDINKYGLENLFLFVLDFGVEYEQLENRREMEINYIQNWPGLLYNIKDILR